METAFEIKGVNKAGNAQYAMLVDIDSCIGCQTCRVACKQENDLPAGINWITAVTIGPKDMDGKLVTKYIPMRCMHCAKAPCMEACPVDAIKKRHDGIVLIDDASCIGCKECIEACPFKILQFNHQKETVGKCSLCAHRVDQGLLPSCVIHCPTGCLYFGETNVIISIMKEKAASKIF